jgi:SOS-response transcriptional repressor LexA
MAGFSQSGLRETATAEMAVLELHAPGLPPEAIGVLLLDVGDDRLHVRIRDHWPRALDDFDRELLQAIAWDLSERAELESGAALLSWLEDRCSHTLRLRERRAVLLHAPATQADLLFQEITAGKQSRPSRAARVIPFRTHVPFYPMHVAAGVFAGDSEVEVGGWIPIPDGLRADPGYFVARVTGRSMEPMVPDGSFCLFRAHPQGSREGKLVLVQKHGASETGGEFTIKRYHSEKAVLRTGEAAEFGDDPEWRHSRVRLISLNPDYPSWDLEADQCQLIAEFVRQLDSGEIPDDYQQLVPDADHDFNDPEA